MREIHKNYTVSLDAEEHCFTYDRGEIERIYFDYPVNDHKTRTLTVSYSNGEKYTWNVSGSVFSGYNFQFCISVSSDGKYVFFQTWENGLFCFDARTGAKLWRTKSRRGVTNVFVNDTTLMCCQHEKAFLLLEIDTGNVIKELKTLSWGFHSLNHKYVYCDAGGRGEKYNVINANALELAEERTDYSVILQNDEYKYLCE